MSDSTRLHRSLRCVLQVQRGVMELAKRESAKCALTSLAIFVHCERHGARVGENEAREGRGTAKHVLEVGARARVRQILDQKDFGVTRHRLHA